MANLQCITDVYNPVSPQKEKQLDAWDKRFTTATTGNCNVKPFKVDIQDKTSFEYKMNHKYRGVALIFNHNKFNNAIVEERGDNHKAINALRECLPTIGFEPNNIIIENNLSKLEILNYVHQLSYTKQEVLENCDCLAVFILSHGSKNNKIYARDGYYDLCKLVEQYTPNNLKLLAAKPKLFFIEVSHCELLFDSGFSMWQRFSYIGQDETDSVPVKEIVSPFEHADILISIQDYTSLNELGFCILDLCDSICYFYKNKLLETTDILDIIKNTHTHKRLRKMFEDSPQDRAYHKKKPIPLLNSTLSRKLYFRNKN